MDPNARPNSAGTKKWIWSIWISNSGGISMFTDRVSRLVLASIFCAALTGAAIPARAQTFSVVGILPSTNGQITNPASVQIAQGRNGDVYALSKANGGIFGASTSGTFAEVVQTYLGDGVTLGADGNFYTNQHYCGGVVKTTPAGTATLIATLCGTDGSGPFSAPIQAPNGLFYGTTTDSFTSGSGTIYSMTSSGALVLLHTFAGTDGSVPTAPLVLGSDGNLYGGTTDGGTNNDGVLFRITPSGTYTVLHNFAGTDGKNVSNSLCLGRDGNLYGVTQNGGTDNDGVIFKLTNSGVFTVLYNMLNPYSLAGSSLVQATDGKLYGVLAQGNASQPGWIYSVTTSGTFSVLHEFCQDTGCSDGVGPSTPLIQHTDGKLYGFTGHGGDTSVCQGAGCGVFYSFDVGLKPFATLVTTSGKVGAKIGILGQGFSAASKVKFNGVTATTVTFGSATFLTATVPAGASDGYVTVTTGSTVLTSSQKFVVHNSWGKGAALPTAVQFPATGTIGSKIYVVGGATATALVNDNQVYTTGTNTWTTAAPIPTSVYGPASAVVNGILYVIGGYVGGSGPATGIVQAYNPTTNTWTTKTSMPTARGSAAAVVDGGMIYVIGGNGSTLRLDTVEKFNPTTDTWTEEAPLLVGKSEPSVGLLGTTIIATDGFTASEDTGDNEAYDVSTNKWSALTADSTHRNASCYGTLLGQLYMAGGSTGSSPLAVTESFNVTTDKWTAQAAMPQAVVAPGSAVANGQLYCFGGSSTGVAFTGSVYSNVQIYQP
jgi:uncharacterized repeat protein (TIGR03803 family)